ncbi:AAA family ATPase [Candidatus Kuenenbacteria bacterium]|nr:AAA family ATPase [Candidatus Kuenenbacteria bacterium]
MKQTQALEILKTGVNVFLTGQAGSGKTYILNQYVKYAREKGKSVSVTATTGIAATHLNGLTIHSWSGLGVKEKLYPSDFEALLKKRHLRRNIIEADILIIDEISMLHARQLDLVNQICQAFRQNLKPFGGLQVILTGDFFQLPPVVKGEDKAEWALQAEVWSLLDMRTCYLDEQYRQDDQSLVAVLNEIRQNSLSVSGRAALLGRLNFEFEEAIFLTKLYTHNIDVDAINDHELQKLAGTAKAYRMQNKGNQTLAEILQKGCLAPARLLLKPGAKVMFVKNNFELGVVNGTVGEVVDFDEDNYPVVVTNKDEVVVARPDVWVIEEDGKIRAEIKQIPLRLAWAITVHKSQGLSLDAAEIDLSKAFTPGMGYVALSRVRSLAGLRLLGFNELALKVDENILQWDDKFRNWSDETEKWWSNLSADERKRSQEIFFQEYTDRPKKGRKKENNKEKTRKLLAQKMKVAEIAKELGLTERTIVGHIEKLLAAGENIDIEYLLPPKWEREEIITAFQDQGDDYLAPVYEILGGIYSYEILKLVRAWLRKVNHRQP